MTKEECVRDLKESMELFLFDQDTGENLQPEQLTSVNKMAYEAMEAAVGFLEKETVNDDKEKNEILNAYQKVYDDMILNSDGCGLFKGIYDAKHGNEHYMYGLIAALEYIAAKAGTIDSFTKMWDTNMALSEEKC